MTAVSTPSLGVRAVNTNGNVSPTIPSGLSGGELLIAWVETASGISTYAAPPSGWNFLGSIQPSGGPGLFIHWKKYAAGDADPTFVRAGTSDPGMSVFGKIAAYPNADADNGPTMGTAYNTGTTAGANAGPIPGVVVTGQGRALLIAGWGDDYSSAPATPAGWTSLVNDTVGTTNGTSYGAFDQAVTSATTSAVTVTGHPTANAPRVGVQLGINEGVQTGSGTLSQSGSGSLSFGGVPAPAGSLGQSGSGAVSLSGVPAPKGSLALTGSGALSVAGGPGGSLARSGSGSLALTPGVVTVSGTLARTGSGSLVFAVSKAVASGSLAVAGAGALVLAGSPRVNVSLSRTGSGALAFTVTPRGFATLARTGTGTLGLTGRAIYRHQVYKAGVWREIVPVVLLSGDQLVVPVKLVAALRGA